MLYRESARMKNRSAVKKHLSKKKSKKQFSLETLEQRQLLAADAFEANDTLATASFLGSDETITINDLTIETAGGAATDVDLFRVIAHDTGRLVVNRGDAPVQLRILDSSGDPITTLLGAAAGGVTVPVVGQQTYFVEATANTVTEYDLNIDNLPAEVPTGVHMDPFDDTGMMNNDMVTSNLRPTFYIQVDLSEFPSSGIDILQPFTANNTTLNNPGVDNILGTADDIEAGAGVAVRVTISDSSDGSNIEGFATRVSGSQNLFEFTPSVSLDQSTHFVSASVVINDGRTTGGENDPVTASSELTEPLWLMIDSTAPDVIAAPQLETYSDSGMLNTDLVTNKMSLAFAGRLSDVGDMDLQDDGIKVRVFGNGRLIGETTTYQGGNWEVTTEPLVDSIYTITAEFEDLAGNVTTFVPNNPLTVEVDTIEPNTPLLALLPTSDTGHPDDGLTSDSRPVFSMTTHDAGANPHIFPDNFKFRIWDRYENQQEFLIYDSSTDATLDDFFTPGDMFTSALINTEQLPSQAAAIALGQTLGAVNVDPVTNVASLADGTHHFKLEVEDRAGNISHDFLYNLTIDTAAPTTTIALADYADSGMSNSDGVTRINSPAFTGLSEVGSLITLYAQQINDNGNAIGAVLPIGTADVGSDASDGVAGNGLGVWEITSEPLDDGVYRITALAEDWAGNSTPTSIVNSVTIEVDTLAPNLPYLDLLEISDSGRSNQDNVTFDDTLSFSMTTEDRTANPMEYSHLLDENLKYRLFVRPQGDLDAPESLLYESATDGLLVNNMDGLTAEQILQRTMTSLPDGVHNFKLEVEDRAGNISDDFNLTVTIDQVAPAGTGDLHSDSDSGVWGFDGTLSDRITSDSTPAFFGTSEANAIVAVEVDGIPAGTAVAIPLDGNDAFQPPNVPYDIIEGNWVAQTNFHLDDGQRTITFTYEDVAGNRSTSTQDIFVDTVGPRVTNVTRNDAEFTSMFDPKPSNGVDPLFPSIVVHFSDLPARTNDFQYEAVFQALVQEEGNFNLIGDANGNIPIVDINVIFEDDGPGQAISRVELVFAEPLPEDRFTLTVSDRISDPAGNALDGESGAIAPFEGNDGDATTNPIFPSGDGQHGGDFIARFTVDSRPEIGVWAAGNVWVDTNGNFSFDPDNTDYVNRDIVYTLGFTSDHIFAGNFTDGVTNDGFDKLAAWGFHDGNWRWLIDVDNDGVPDIDSVDPNESGLPAAGNFDGNAANGDEVSTLNHGWWHFDTDHDYQTDLTIETELVGYPIVGDFDGNGIDDLATWSDDKIQIDLDGGVVQGWDGVADVEFRFGYIGTRERPVAADMDQDGFDDIGLWVPDREGVTPGEASEWYWLISGGDSLLNRVVEDTDPVEEGLGTIEFTPVPFGNDIYAQYGDEFSLPVVGNFDPPVLPASSQPVDTVVDWTNELNPLDVDGNGAVLPLDALILINALNANEGGQLEGKAPAGMDYDTTGDGLLTAFDVLQVINYLNDQSVAEGEAAAAVDASLAETTAKTEATPSEDSAWAADHQLQAATEDSEIVSNATHAAVDAALADFADEEDDDTADLTDFDVL